jgi:hypothetical protein
LHPLPIALFVEPLETFMAEASDHVLSVTSHLSFFNPSHVVVFANGNRAGRL